MLFNLFKKHNLLNDYSVDEKSFIDLDFKIKSVDQRGDFVNVKAFGYWKDKLVSIGVDNLPLKAEPVFKVVDGNFVNLDDYYKDFVYISYDESLPTLYNYYASEKLEVKFEGQKTLKATLMSLTPWQARLNREEVKFKLFLDSSEFYVELFLILNMNENIIKIHEKDISYRIDLIKSLK